MHSIRPLYVGGFRPAHTRTIGRTAPAVVRPSAIEYIRRAGLPDIEVTCEKETSGRCPGNSIWSSGQRYSCGPPGHEVDGRVRPRPAGRRGVHGDGPRDRHRRAGRGALPTSTWPGRRASDRARSRRGQPDTGAGPGPHPIRLTAAPIVDTRGLAGHPEGPLSIFLSALDQSHERFGCNPGKRGDNPSLLSKRGVRGIPSSDSEIARGITSITPLISFSTWRASKRSTRRPRDTGKASFSSPGLLARSPDAESHPPQ